MKSLFIRTTDDLGNTIFKIRPVWGDKSIFVSYDGMKAVIDDGSLFTGELRNEFKVQMARRVNTLVLSIISNKNGRIINVFYNVADVVEFVNSGKRKGRINMKMSATGRLAPCYYKWHVRGIEMDDRTKVALRNTMRNWAVVNDTMWYYPLSNCDIELEPEKEFFGRTKFNIRSRYKLPNGEIKNFAGELFPKFDPRINGEFYDLTENLA